MTHDPAGPGSRLGAGGTPGAASPPREPSRRAGRRRRPEQAHVLEGGRDAELEAGSDAHYVDPTYYAATYADRQDDIDFYVALASERAPAQGPILEYGCGSGRILLPLARCGFNVVGVDRSPEMLRALQTRRDAQPELAGRLTFRRGDMRRVALRRRFPLVLCTFNTFLHLYTRRDVEHFLRRVRDHLTPRGTFALDVSLPDPEELSRDPNRISRVTPFRHPSTGEVVRYGERFDYDPLRQVLLVSMEFEPRGAPERRWMTPLAHRQFFPRELEALLHYNGFSVTEVYGDFTREPPDADTVDLTLVCRRRRGW